VRPARCQALEQSSVGSLALDRGDERPAGDDIGAELAGEGLKAARLYYRRLGS